MAPYIVQELSSPPAVTSFAFLAQTPAPAPAGAGSSGTTSAGGNAQMFIPLLIIAGVYFLIFAPHFKRQNAHKKLVAALKAGDEVVTTGGIFGVVTQVKPDRLVVEIAKNTRVELEKAAVTAVVSAELEAKANPAPGKGAQA